MAQDPKPSRPLSEIGHLFLSSVRQRQTNGAPMPVRQPPGSQPPSASAPKTIHPRRDVTIDLTPEEFAQVYGEGETSSAQPADEPSNSAPRLPAVTAILGAHLNGKQLQRVKEYARHLASSGQRIGLMIVDAVDFRLLRFEQDGLNGAAVQESAADERQMTAAIDEMSFDVDRWLLLVPQSRAPEARQIIAATDHWTMLSTCDHDGVVSCYRTLKGLSDLHRPRLSLALLEVRSLPEAGRIFRKLAGVCQQFLNWPVEEETPISKAENVTEYEVMRCRPAATGPQWRVVGEFLARVRATGERPAAPQAKASPMPKPEPTQMLPLAQPAMAAQAEETAEVVELDEHADSAGILDAVLSAAKGELIECPVALPNGAKAKVAITRERTLVLIAVAGPGLADLPDIAQAYRWMSDSHPLISMALPQLSIDILQHPQLRILVDQSDRGAMALEPMLHSAHLRLQTYRRLRWGEKHGLLLQAA